ncbi:MAG: hypothetical protein AMJ45_06105 [Syntrophobacter sp. DG_60]|nr:MAG: hypothetical protein AMJ45_06105 [Syntrophobacter sp. DG_60]
MHSLSSSQWALLIIILFLPMVPTFWAIIDVAKRETSAIYLKFFWFALVVLIPCIGGIFYLLLGRRSLAKRA